MEGDGAVEQGGAMSNTSRDVHHLCGAKLSVAPRPLPRERHKALGGIKFLA